MAAVALVALALVAGGLGADTGSQPRPIALGVSGGSIEDHTTTVCCGGTLGALVTDGSTQYILSNNHVLARTNKATIGDAVIQPGLIDQAPACTEDATDVVATLSDFEPILFSRPGNRPVNYVDAAIAQVVPGKVRTDGAIAGIGTLSSAPATAFVGQSVRKAGRTTGLTAGAVTAVNATVTVRYGGCGGARGRAKFKQQVMVGPETFSAGGDSGSLIVDDAAPPHAVGLLFAGSSTSTIANPILNVLSTFGVSIVGQSAMASHPSTRWLGALWPAMATAEAAGSGRLNARAIAAARQAQSRHEDALLQVGGVHGVGVGASDVLPGDAVVEVYVERDTPAVRAALPRAVDGVAVKVVATGEFVAFSLCEAR
jgi:hypothetical protein